MNDNSLGIDRVEELFNAAIMNLNPNFSSGGGEDSEGGRPPMGTKPININLEKAGALMVGDHNSVSVHMTREVTLLDPLSLEMEGLIRQIAESRHGEANQVRQDLAAALGLSDPALIPSDRTADAVRILRSWHGSMVEKAVNEQPHRMRGT